VVDILNSLNTSAPPLTTNDATRTTLEVHTARRSRERRANDVANFVVWFPKSLVTFAEAAAAAETVTPDSPIVINFAKSSNPPTTEEATATHAEALAGTGAPTAAVVGSGSGSGSGDNYETATAIWATVVVVLVACLCVYVAPRRPLVFQ
jgi:hypothetical protein